MSETATPAVRILVADDYEVVRLGITSIFENEPGLHVVAEASDGREAFDKAIEVKPQVAIIDYLLPLMNGIDVISRLRPRLPNTEFMMLTVHDSDVLIREAVNAGARAFVLKSDAQGNIIAAVKALALRQPYFTGRFSETLLRTILASKTSGVGTLTAQERVVVQLVAEGKSNKEIGSILHLSHKTIETPRASAMRKLEVTSTASLIRYAFRNRLAEP